MDNYNYNLFVPVAKRTRLQTAQGFSSSARNRSRKRNREPGVVQCGVDDHEVIDLDDCSASEPTVQHESDDKIKCYGSASPFKTGTDTYVHFSDEEGFSGPARNQSRTRDHEVIDVDDDCRSFEPNIQHEPDDTNHTIKCYGSASPFKTGIDTYAHYKDDSDEEETDDTSEDLKASGNLNNTDSDPFWSTEDESSSSSEFKKPNFKRFLSQLNKRPYGTRTNPLSFLDNSDSDEHEGDGYVNLEEHEVSCKYDRRSQKDTKASSFQFTEDVPIDSSESESDDLDDTDLLSVNKRPHRRTQNDKEKAWSGSASRKEKSPSVHKTNTKSTCQIPRDESSDTEVNEKQNAIDKVISRYLKGDKAKSVKSGKFKKGGRRDVAACINAILESVINNEEDHITQEDECLPSHFKFDDTEDESSQKSIESNGEELFEEMEFALKCEEVGSYRIPQVENQEEDDYYDDNDLCKNGVHGDTYFEEQTGLRCLLCGNVLVESRYVIPKLASYAPDRSNRRRRFDEQQFFSHENPYYMDLDSNPYDACKQTKGTVWELIPTHIQARMYSHQQEGFEFLWNNLAGTIELTRLHKLCSRGSGGVGGGGCIISHAPGTGKTFLTIVFMESFLKKFPKCCPVIIAPASMLLTWEAEFKKWRVGISFINLHNTEHLRREMSFGSSTRNKDLIRAMKISSWTNGGSVLGVSYNLYEKLAGDSYSYKNIDHEKIRTCLLDMPGLVVLDEGHTPRSENSKIWNTLLKLKTRNRVILSGTPFQNNFRELFNTLKIVRPATANSIVKEKFFADMIQRRNMRKFRGRSRTEDIEKLKEIILPFVHVHKGHILESKLPGLRQSVIFLNPSPFQKGFIENLGTLGSTFEYEHKVTLVAVHPSLILHCSLSEKEENSINKQELEDVRLQPEVGVKTRFVMELIRLSLPLNEKVLIFSQFIHPQLLLQDQIAHAFGWSVEKEITLIQGKIQQTRRQNIINAFNDPKSELKVLLASIRCCSEGIHLYGASRVVLLDVVWNPSVEIQAISRAYRLGQKKVVYTYHLMAAGTTEEEKYDRHVRLNILCLIFNL
ncbi:putative DNA helicase chromatin remodeling SNF2 family [Helianthus annuus]|nr:putative DNA helicase chromatin remodeling SNF2 family [Helianthus annuus]